MLDGSKAPTNTNAVDLGNAAYVVLRGFDLVSSRGAGIDRWGGHFIDIVGNTVRSSAQAAITVGVVSNQTDATDFRIHGNTVYNNGLEGKALNPNAPTWSAIVRGFGASRVPITNNLVHDNFGEGIDFILTEGGSAVGNLVYDNFSGRVAPGRYPLWHSPPPPLTTAVQRSNRGNNDLARPIQALADLWGSS